ncbi:type I secretion system permease/ATPase [Pseudocolwellia agarivorans]|uniref:type I secretion system permease/ATPase n=1 Tax=Pseudocolwellia agarivorans TaxID=1911682 RepID=UPI00098594E0|nr:type I secretion system permease/ATPase [Pseudocolwellia agarivorans]
MDTGVISLCIVAQLNNVAVDAEQVAQRFGQSGHLLTSIDLTRAAKSLGFKARYTSILDGGKLLLSSKILPVIAETREDQYLVIARMSAQTDSDTETRFLVHDPLLKKPQNLTENELISLISGKVLLVTKRESLLKSMNEFDISWFIPAFKKYKKLFYDVLIASFFLQIFALATPLFFQVVMDKVLVHNSLSTLDVLAIGFFAVTLFDVLLGGIRTYVFSHTTTRVDVELGAKLYKHLIALPLSYFETRQVGQTVARVHELDSIRQFITGTALTLCIDLLFTFVFFGVMFYYSTTLALVVLASIPLYILLSVLITPTLRARVNEKFEQGAKNQSFLVESISGVETVKACSLEPQMQRNWEDKLANYVSASFKAQHIGNISSQTASFINKLTTLGIIWFGAQAVMLGELTVGQLVAFNMLAGRISGPILKIVQLWQDFQQAQISVKRLGDILNIPTESQHNQNRSALPKVQGNIEFKQINFRYQPNTPLVLENINLNIKVGEVVGIVGSSGSGKSTLTKLVQRFYTPESGQVKVDGIDICSADVSWLRQNIGVVLQDSFLFNRTVRENIALTSPAMPIDRVIQAAKLAGAHEFISSMPKGYDTEIDEQGSNLSGGQKQRLAIARTLLTNPRILIFDEATSALDYESEKIIQMNMQAICKGRTVLIIAHRLNAVQHCHRLIVMDKGKVVEQGTHQQLINQKGYFAKLYALQGGTTKVLA